MENWPISLNFVAMRSLKHIRVVLSLLFFFEAVAFIVWGVSAPRHSRVAFLAQVLPSSISATMAVTAFWLVITFLLGRVYCSTVCPLGTLQDIIIRGRCMVRRCEARFHYIDRSRRRFRRLHVIIIYIAVLIAGGTAAAAWLEPWNWFGNMLRIPRYLAAGMTFGAALAILSAVVFLIFALLTGREFCNTVCPVGAGMACLSKASVMHIELDPDKCDSCLKCEELCKARCISIKDRRIDNASCVRCFNCVSVCPRDAIRFQYNRNNAATPLFRSSRRTAT